LQWDLFETAQLSDWLKFMSGDYIVKEGDRGSAFWLTLKFAFHIVQLAFVYLPFSSFLVVEKEKQGF